MIHSSFTAGFDSGYVGKQPVDWKEYRAENWLKELQAKCTGRRDITEILLKTALNTMKSMNQSVGLSSYKNVIRVGRDPI